MLTFIFVISTITCDNNCVLSNIKEYKAYYQIKFINEKYNIGLNAEYICSLAKIIAENSNKYNVDVNDIISIIMIESAFKYKIGDKGNSIGLMQVHINKNKQFLKNKGITKNDLLDDRIGIMIGTELYSILLQKYKNKKNAIIAYNGGYKAVRSNQKGETIPSKEYYDKFLKILSELKKNKLNDVDKNCIIRLME